MAFNFFKRHNNAPTPAPETAPNMPDPAEAYRRKELLKQKHEDKLTAVILTGDPKLFRGEAPYIPDKDRDDVMRKMAHGEITKNDEADIIGKIARPYDRDGAESVFNALNETRQMRRILAMGSGLGFDGVGEVTPDSVEDFLANYPTPVHAEEFRTTTLERIRRSNPEAKYQQYVDAFTEFEQRMYGKQKEYYTTFEEMKQKGIAQFGSAPVVPNIAPRPTGNAPERMEQREKLSEHLADFGRCDISKRQAKEGLRPRLGERVDFSESQDTALARPDVAMFGVFDGVGGSENGQGASKLAAKTVENLVADEKPHFGQELAQSLLEANKAIMQSEVAGRGQTTGVVAKVNEYQGRKVISWAMVGDSRLYHVSPEGKATLITRDEGEGNKITNAIGIPYGRVEQFGDFYVDSGDRLVLCSDGITGDWAQEMLSNEEIGEAVASSQNDAEASNKLVNMARKNDDRTALVFTIK